MANGIIRSKNLSDQKFFPNQDFWFEAAQFSVDGTTTVIVDLLKGNAKFRIYNETTVHESDSMNAGLHALKFEPQTGILSIQVKMQEPIKINEILIY